MDPSGCTSGWATDNMLRFHPLEPCQVPLPAFYSILLTLILIKLWILWSVWTFWVTRFREMKKTRATAQRHPIVPTLLTCVAVLMILMTSLVGSNVISASNGGCMLIYALSSFCWGGYCLLLVRKYVGVSRRLIPLAMAQGPGEGGSASGSSRGLQSSSEQQQQVAPSQAAEKALSRLNKLDLPLKLMMLLMILILVATVLVAIIPGLIYPTEERWTRTMFGLIGGFALLLAVSLDYHLERLIDASKICGQNLGKSQASMKLKRAIKMMRVSQMVWFIMGSISFLAHVLVADYVIDPSWICVLVLLCVETLCSSFAFFATKARPKRRANPVSKDITGAPNPLTTGMMSKTILSASAVDA